ncbi:MAG: hypothetical protein AAFU67_17605, partial [Bacteroidota bacterium]
MIGNHINIDKNFIICFLACGIITSLMFSLFFLSVGMILLAFCSLINWRWEERRPVFFLDQEALASPKL